MRRRGSLVVPLLVFAPGFAWAQSYPACTGDPIDPHPVLSGHVFAYVSTPIVGATVRVWREVGSKGWAIDCVATTASGGAWTVNRPPGRYKIEALGSGSTDVNLGQRWYDVAEPFAGGWAGEDADVFEADEPVSNIDVVLPLNGGLNIEVRAGSMPTGGIQTRLLRQADVRVHHNDQTQGGPHLGRFYMRGLVPASDYVLLLHDPSGAYGLTTVGPYTITGGADLAGGSVDLVAAPTDAHEPNNTPGALGAYSVDAAGLHAPTPVPWVSASARIGGGGDLDWFCWAGEEGDRYHVSTSSMFANQLVTMRNPWLDPMVSVWDVSGAAPVLLVEDDDGGPDRDAVVDTLDIPSGGDLCAVVTTYGDADWNGTGQQSVGTYALRVEMGNRRPKVFVTRDGFDVPAPPDSVVVSEDEEIVLDVSLVDPEGDTDLTAEVAFVDAFGLQVSGWTFDFASGEGTFTWTPGPQAAEDGPYALSITAGDAELWAVTERIVAVATVNTPPEMPIALAPIDGETVITGFPTLSVTNGSDIDGDALWVEFEAFLDPLDDPWVGEVVVEDAGGVTSWDTPFVPDATDVWWRARSFDGDLYSGWTDLEPFLVATFNDPPSVPGLEKPALGEVVLVRRPALGVLDSTDPENDAVSLTFEVSLDTTFAVPVATGGPIAQDDLGPTTAWTIDDDLPWGADAYWRVRAADARGAESAWSPTFWFQVKANVEPTAPGLAAPLGPSCDDVVLDTAPASFPVTNATDPEGEPLTLEVALFDAAAPAGAPPVASASVPQSAGATTDVPLSYVYTEDGHYRVQVRADDGTDVSAWAVCAFWVDGEDAPTTGFAITDPPEGDVLTAQSYTVDAVVTNPLDPDGHLPGAALELAWCLDATGDACAAGATSWNRLAFHDGASTTFQVAGLEPDGDWILWACAVDAAGTCHSEDSVSFRTAAPLGDGTDDEGKCGCGGGPVGPWGWLAGLLVLARRRSSPKV